MSHQNLPSPLLKAPSDLCYWPQEGPRALCRVRTQSRGCGPSAQKKTSSSGALPWAPLGPSSSSN